MPDTRMTDEMLNNTLDVPEEGLIFPPPIRAFHLSGGLWVLMSINHLAALISPGGNGMTFFSVLKNASLTSVLREQSGVRILGRNHFSVAEEMEDAVTQNFAISASTAENQCLASAQTHQWQGLATALHRLKRDPEALMARRVALQIRLCLTRLERLSAAYRTVLTNIGNKQEPGRHKFTSDKYAQYLGSEYRSVLNELYSLRDAVLAASYRLHLKRTDSFSVKKIRPLVADASDGSSRMISEAMFSTHGDLLIRNMSLYRSVAQHCIGATNPVFGDVYQILTSRGPLGEHPYLVYPLYDNLERMREIEEGSSRGVLEPLPEEEGERFMGLGEYKDALEFCYDCFVRLLRIAENLEREIGIEPQQVTITDADIMEMTITDETGKVTRAKRDESGRLVEY